MAFTDLRFAKDLVDAGFTRSEIWDIIRGRAETPDPVPAAAPDNPPDNPPAARPAEAPAPDPEETPAPAPKKEEPGPHARAEGVREADRSWLDLLAENS